MTKSTDTVFTLSISDLQKRAEKAAAIFEQLTELLPGLSLLTEADRRHSEGKLRDGEGDALGAVIDVADAHPQYFTSLADKDGGRDPDAFETELLRDHLERRLILADVLTAYEAFVTSLGDTILTLGEQVRPPLLAAYHIAKPLAATDANVRARLAPALDFYGRIARRAAETRLARKPPGGASS